MTIPGDTAGTTAADPEIAVEAEPTEPSYNNEEGSEQNHPTISIQQDGQMNELHFPHLKDESLVKEVEGPKYLAYLDDDHHDKSPSTTNKEGAIKFRTTYLPYLDDGEHDDESPRAEEDAVPQGHSTMPAVAMELPGAYFQEVMAPQPPPAEPIRRQDPTMPIQVGAFAGAPGEGLRRRDDISFSLVGIDLSGEQITYGETTLGEPDDDPVQPTLHPSDRGNNNAAEAAGDRLAEATPVEDGELPDTEAKPYDVEAATKRKSKQTKERKKRFLALVLVFACLVASVIVGFVYHKKMKNEEEDLSPTVSRSLAPSHFPSSAPSGAMDLFREGLPEYTRASLEIFDSPQWKAS